MVDGALAPVAFGPAALAKDACVTGQYQELLKRMAREHGKGRPARSAKETLCAMRARCEAGSGKRVGELCVRLLRRYGIPEGIVRHSAKVAEVSRFIARGLIKRGERVDLDKLTTGALLHDIGKSTRYARGNARNHAEASAEIVRREGLPDVAQIVSRHILDSIVSSGNCPRGWEEKIVFYADKIVTHRLVSVDERFADLQRRRPDIRDLLEASFAPTKALESEILQAAGLTWRDLVTHLG